MLLVEAGREEGGASFPLNLQFGREGERMGFEGVGGSEKVFIG